MIVTVPLAGSVTSVTSLSVPSKLSLANTSTSTGVSSGVVSESSTVSSIGSTVTTTVAVSVLVEPSGFVTTTVYSKLSVPLKSGSGV